MSMTYQDMINVCEQAKARIESGIEVFREIADYIEAEAQSTLEEGEDFLSGIDDVINRINDLIEEEEKGDG